MLQEILFPSLGENGKRNLAEKKIEVHIAKTGKAPDGNSSKEERLQESVHVATLGTGEGPHGNGQLGCREVMSLFTELPGAQRLRLARPWGPSQSQATSLEAASLCLEGGSCLR